VSRIPTQVGRPPLATHQPNQASYKDASMDQGSDRNGTAKGTPLDSRVTDAVETKIVCIEGSALQFEGDVQERDARHQIATRAEVLHLKGFEARWKHHWTVAHGCQEAGTGSLLNWSDVIKPLDQSPGDEWRSVQSGAKYHISIVNGCYYQLTAASTCRSDSQPRPPRHGSRWGKKNVCPVRQQPTVHLATALPPNMVLA
jgi:hypothetical protein